jgi:hypothetical protein
VNSLFSANSSSPRRVSRGLRASLSIVGPVFFFAAVAIFAVTAASQSPCPAVQTGKLYRFIQGQDGSCAVLMTPQEIAQELHDPFWTNILAMGTWPGTVNDIASAITSALPAWPGSSFLVGEGSQVPASLVSRDGNRDLRYVIGWGPANATPTIFLSARPPQVQGGDMGPNPQTAMEVISLDPVKKVYNYYQFINSDKNYAPPPSTWTWSGDSHSAWKGPSAATGCFKCHVNGGLNMKELTAPWNNWNATSPGATINPGNVPQSLANASLFQGLQSAAILEDFFTGSHTALFGQFLSESIQGPKVSNVPRILERLVNNTTMNFASSQVQSSTGAAVTLPRDFFLYDSILRDPSINLSYRFPTQLGFKGQDYAKYIGDKQFSLVNCTDGTPKYSVPGATFFAGFVPVRPFEDTDAIRQLLSQNVVSQQFAVAVLMVDFQNPVFSQVRSKLMTYASQIQTANLSPDPNDAPTQFANLIRKTGAKACTKASIQDCTPEEQFLYYYQSDFATLAVQQINAYLNSVQRSVSAGRGVNDYMGLLVSRGVQFANWNPMCNLNEKELLLPCTSLGKPWFQMNVDGTIGQQSSYQCSTPPPDPCSCNLGTKHVR